jgi:serine/threonine protein kinase
LKFTEQVVRFWIAALVVAMSMLHQRGLLMRSLKPEAVILDNEGHLYLTDFNLWKLVVNRRRTGSFAFVLPTETGIGRANIPRFEYI